VAGPRPDLYTGIMPKKRISIPEAISLVTAFLALMKVVLDVYQSTL
jgi:hypothetical protein